MRNIMFVIAASVFLCAQTAEAGTAEVRETARLNNCAPKKIQVYQQQLGNNPLTMYRVDCIEPKTVGENLPKTPSAILIACEANICRLLRPLQEQQQ